MTQFEIYFNRIVGLECWGIIAGSGTGSNINMQFGRKIPRAKPLKNPSLTNEQREFDSEFSVFVECVWRLDSETEIVCGAWDNNRENGLMIIGLHQLVGSVVSSVQILKPAFDLIVSFSNGLALKVFCDNVSPIDANDNYSLFTPDLYYTVGTRSVLRKTFRQFGVSGE